MIQIKPLVIKLRDSPFTAPSWPGWVAVKDGPLLNWHPDGLCRLTGFGVTWTIKEEEELEKFLVSRILLGVQILRDWEDGLPLREISSIRFRREWSPGVTLQVVLKRKAAG